jgi:hypothetical protein
MGVIQNRVEHHGDSDVTAFDIPLELLLDPDELNALVGDYAHNALFNTKGKVAEPMFPDFDSFALKHDLENAHVALAIGNGSTDYAIEWDDARLKGLTLSPLTGGETHLSFRLQVRPQNKHITKLFDTQNCELKISLSDAKIVEKTKKRQQELPLDAPPAGVLAGNGAMDGIDGPTQDERMRARHAEKVAGMAAARGVRNAKRGKRPHA